MRASIHPGIFTVLLICAAVLAQPLEAGTVLFDAAHAQQAGNADWVIDSDAPSYSVPRFPTPPASGITSTTPETYWTGAISAWAVALVKLGHDVESLPPGGRFTYLDATNPQDLANYQVLVVPEPNTRFTAVEREAIVRFVQAGGGLFIGSNHSGSDRNNNGVDPPIIWNQLFSDNGVSPNPFGVTVNADRISVTSSTRDPEESSPLTNGSVGPATQLKFSAGATLTIDPAANSSVRGAFWRNSTFSRFQVMAAYGTFGQGKFVAFGDSSPPDDGTGAPNNTLYTGWTDLGGSHSNFLLNALVYLLPPPDPTAPPRNDAFANAFFVPYDTTLLRGHNRNATLEPGEPIPASGSTASASAWWKIAPAGGTVRVTTAGSSFGTILAAYSGAAVENLSLISRDEGSASDGSSAITFTVKAGDVVHISVSGKNGTSGDIVLNFSQPPPPAPSNDLFANPIVITGSSGRFTADTKWAGRESGEPFHDGSSGQHSVWYSFTPATDGYFEFNTQGSSFDTVLAVHTGDSLSTLSKVASDDDSGSGSTSKLTLTATAGITYWIAVDGFSDASGIAVLNFLPGSEPPPRNDAFNFAEAIPAGIPQVSGNNTLATRETGEPNHAGVVGSQSLWWKFTAARSGVASISTAGSAFDTLLAAYTGSRVRALTPIASNNDFGGLKTSAVSFLVSAGTVYYIAVDSAGSANGEILLNLKLPEPVRPANDDFAGALPISGEMDATAPVDTAAATSEADELIHRVGTGHSIWYSWIAPGSFPVQVDTIGSGYDTVLAVYTGESLSSLTPVASDDDSGGSFTSRLSFLATEGVKYSFAIASFSNSTGQAILHLMPVPQVALTASASFLEEPRQGETGRSVTLTFRFSPAPAAAGELKLSVGGSAAQSVDFSLSETVLERSVNIPYDAGENAVHLILTPLADDDPTEGSEYVSIRLSSRNSIYVPDLESYVVLTLTDHTPYSESWSSRLRAAGITGLDAAPLADPGDYGVPNLLRFAFAMDPAKPSLAGLPTLGTAFLPEEGGKFLTLTFDRFTNAASTVEYRLQETADLALDPSGWESAVPIIISTVPGEVAGTETVTFRAPRPYDGIGSPPRSFIRMEIREK